MIQVSELRIGNWFYIGEMIGQCNADSFKDTSIFDPIPLTPEILEKCDWNDYKKFCINSYFKIDEVGHLYYCGDFTGINIEHLHQLQNLYFALTGKELTFKP
jgi:hypothetical protein